MAHNVFGNQPNVGIAKVTATFEQMNINATNMFIVYEVRSPLYSWMPDRAINAIDKIVEGRGYYFVPKFDMDLTAYFAPPLTGGGGGACGPVVNAGIDQDLPSNTTTTNLVGTVQPPQGETIESTRWIVVDYPSIYPIPQFSASGSLSTGVSGLKSGQYVFQLQAKGSGGITGVDSISVLVAEPDEILVDAGADQELDEGSTTTNLYGDASTSGEVEIVGYEWSVVTPDRDDVVFTRQGEKDTGVTGLPHPSVTVFRLTAEDQLGRKFHDDVTVEVLTPSVMFKVSGWDNARPSQQMWVYQPQGYKPQRAQGYPFILFLHGMGENGDETFEGVPNNDNPDVLLRETAGLPFYIYNKRYPMKSLVLMPQLHTGLWDVTAAQKVVDFALANYNLDLTTVGVTGLSSGGKGSFDIALANPSLFSASMPCNPVYSEVGAGGGATVKDIAFLVITSYGDETGAPPNATGGAFAAIDSIAAANPKGLYPPRCICGWDYGHVPETWNWLAYDKTRAVFDFEKDFFLLHSKTYSTTCTNYVVRAEASKTFYDWSLAAVQLDRLAAGSVKTALQARMNTVLTAMTTGKGHRYIMLNLGSNGTNPFYTSNNLATCTANSTVANMLDVQNAATTIGFTVLANTSTAPGTDAIAHHEMGMHSSMFSSYFQVGGSNWRFSGLDQNKRYDFYVYCSDRSTQLKSSGVRTGCEISFNGIWTQLNYEGWNTMFLARCYNVAPDGSGNIAVTANPMYTGKGVVNAILIREHAAENNRANIAKFNFAANSNGVDGAEYATISSDPTLAPATATDPVSGWKLETIGQAPPYWKKYYDQYWADNNVYNVNIPTPMAGLPQVVARSGWFNDNQYFSDTDQNYNLHSVGTPGMGFRAGLYTVKFYAATTNAEGSVGEFVCKFSYDGIQKLRLNSANNSTGKFVSFTGRMKEGDFIKMGIFMPGIYGQVFVNYIEIERVED